MSPILGFHHVQLAMPAGGEDRPAGSTRASSAWRRSRSPLSCRPRGGCWFRGGEAELHLGTEDGFRSARNAHPAVLVDDLDAMRDRLAAAGHEIMLDADFAGHRRFYISDPFGNRLEVISTGR